MKVIPKLILFLLLLGLVLKAIKLYGYQNNMQFITEEEVYPWYFKTGYYGNICVSMAAVLSFIFYRKYFPLYVSACYLLMILLVILTSINDFEDIINKPSIIYSVKGIGTFINFGILFFAAKLDDFKKVLSLFYGICFVFIVAGFINLAKVGFGSDRTQYLYAVRDYAVYFIWVFPYFLLQEEQRKAINLFNLLTYLLIFVFILSTGSRSYLVIFSLYLIVKFKEQLRSKNTLLLVFGTIILLSIAYLVFYNSVLGKVLEGAFNILSERSAEDSRSDQLVEFMNQFDINYLWQGVGPMGLWYWSAWGGYYYYLDNQFLLLAWWAGLPVLIIYLIYIIKPLLKAGEIQLFNNVNGLRMILGLWILACAGFAIYVGISSDLYYDFITLLIGMQTCKYSLLLEA